jgi:hypothetical protein
MYQIPINPRYAYEIAVTPCGVGDGSYYFFAYDAGSGYSGVGYYIAGFEGGYHLMGAGTGCGQGMGDRYGNGLSSDGVSEAV